MQAHWCCNTKCVALDQESAAQNLYIIPLMSWHQIPVFRPGNCGSESIYQPTDVVTTNAWLQSRNLLLKLYTNSFMSWYSITKCLSFKPGICCLDSRLYVPAQLCPNTKCLALRQEPAAYTLYISQFMSLHQLPGFRPVIYCVDFIYEPNDVQTPNAWLQAKNLLLRLYISAHGTRNTKCLAPGQESAA